MSSSSDGTPVSGGRRENDDFASANCSTIDTLRSRYYKYLDTLCTANAVDIASLKGSAEHEHRQLELFFGGLPVLVGLKYFSALRTLRLFGQEVLSIRPLSDVAETLEELWICEGPLKDIRGIESCTKLRQLYLYDCLIEDASLIGRLFALESLWIMNNHIKDFSFISTLPSLKVLYAGGAQFSETAALSVEEWPAKLQHLDLASNSLGSLKELFLVIRCTVMRVLNFSDERAITSPRAQPIAHEMQLAWLAFHFCYLERLNGDCVAEKFSETYTNLANKELIDQQHRWLVAERAFRVYSERIRRNSEKIDERLRALIVALLKAMATVAKREGRREIVLQTLRQAQNNLERFKFLKKNYVIMEYFAHRLSNYYVPSWRLESARCAEYWPQELPDAELRALEHSLRFRCAKKDELALKVRYALRIVADDATAMSLSSQVAAAASSPSISTAAFDQLLIIRFFENTVSRIVGSKTRISVRLEDDVFASCRAATMPSSNCNLRLAIYLADNCHRRGSRSLKSSEEHAGAVVCTVTDVADILTPEDYANGFIVLPLFRNRPQKLGPQESAAKIVGLCAEKFSNTDDADKMLLNLRDLDVVMLCLLEINELKGIQFDDFNDVPAFDERIARQIKKFKELGIEIGQGSATPVPSDTKLTDEVNENNSALANLLSADKNSTKKNRYRVSDIDVATELGSLRWRADRPLDGMMQRSLSLRNPLDLMFALYRVPTFKNKDFFQKSVTCLDISEMKLKKLNGVECLTNLAMLNASRNRIATLEPLNALESLVYLDVSFNKLSKINELPITIIELNLAKNSLNCLLFCSRLQSLRKLNVNMNRVKSLKGVETAKDLTVLLCANNLLRDRNEIELLTHFTALYVVDLLDNPITEMESFRKRLLYHCPSLISINHEKVPNEEKNLIPRKSGRVLTLEYLERHFGTTDTAQSLMLCNQDFRMIVFDHQAILKLQSVTFLNLSNNFLEHIYEVIELDNLRRLNLANNTIVSLCADGQISATTGIPVSQITILPNLTYLNLSMNKINNQTLARLEIGKLMNLEILDLSGNELTKLDSSWFEANTVLRELDLSRNDIRALVRKKTLTTLRILNLANNKLKDIEGLCFSNIETLNLSNNKISNCAGLKSVGQLPNLRDLICTGNTVTERRVYVDFILEQAPKLQNLDGISRETMRIMPPTADKRSGSIAQFTIDAVDTLSAGATLEILPTSASPETIGRLDPDHRVLLPTRFTPEQTPPNNSGYHEPRSIFAISRRQSNFAMPQKLIVSSTASTNNAADYTYFPIGMHTSKSMPSMLGEASFSNRNRNNGFQLATDKRKSLIESAFIHKNGTTTLGIPQFSGLDVFGTRHVQNL